MVKRLKNTLLAALLAAGIAGGAQAAGVTDKEIVLGTHLDLSGPVAAGMPSLRNGMQMRLDEANDAGGVNGRKFRIVVEDNGSQPQMAVRAIDKLIRKDEVFAIVNAFGSATNAAVVKRAVDEGVVYFAPWGASSIIRKSAADNQLLFTTTPNYDTNLGQAAVTSIGNGITTFAGPRDDGFYSDIPGIFDLLDSRILDNNGSLADGLGQDGNGVDGFKGYNVLSIAMQIPVSALTSFDYTAPFADLAGGLPAIGAARGVGVYASVSRPRRYQVRPSSRMRCADEPTRRPACHEFTRVCEA